MTGPFPIHISLRLTVVDKLTLLAINPQRFVEKSMYNTHGTFSTSIAFSMIY